MSEDQDVPSRPIDLREGAALNGAVLITSAPLNGSEREQIGLDVLRQLREDIVAGVYGPGQKLKFEDLRLRYDASMGSLREALLHLVSEGLVRTVANKGFSVAPVSVADLMDITALRVQFERQALSDAMAHGDDDWEAEIVTALHLLMKLAGPDGLATRSSDWPQRHRRFHEALVAGCRSPWLLHFRGVLFDQAERYRSLGRLYRRAPRDVALEHRELAEAVLARDAAVALALAERHIRSTVENVTATVPGLAEPRPADLTPSDPKPAGPELVAAPAKVE